MRKGAKKLGTLLILLGIAGLLREWWLPLPARLILRDDRPQPGAPVLVLLLGDVGERAGAAADAYNSGRARKIVIAHGADHLGARLGVDKSEWKRSVEILVALGVPRGDIVALEGRREVTSTREEAEELAGALEGMRPKPDRVILLTSWYHTRRAARVLERVLAGSGIAVQALPAWPSTFTPSDWWHSEMGLVTVFEEYVKTALYLWRGQL